MSFGQMNWDSAKLGLGSTIPRGGEPIPSNDVFIAHMLPQTKNIRLGTGVTIITQHHPANVAVRLAYLDHLAKGRLNVGFGQGGVPTDWALFDLPDPRTQGLMTLEAMDIVLKTLARRWTFRVQGRLLERQARRKGARTRIGSDPKALPAATPANRNEYRQGRVYGRHDRRAAGIHSNQHQHGTTSQGQTAVGTLL